MSGRLVLDDSTSEGRLLKAFGDALDVGRTCCWASKRTGLACSTARTTLPILRDRGLVERVAGQGTHRVPLSYRITGAGKQALVRGHQDWPEVFDGA